MNSSQDYIAKFRKYLTLGHFGPRTDLEQEKLDLRKSQIGHNSYRLPKNKKARAKRLQQIQDQERARRLARIQRELS